MFLTDKNPNHRHGGLLSWTHPSGSRPLEDICTSSETPGSFWHVTEGASITHQCRANWGADWPQGQWRRAASRAELLSNPVMDTHVAAATWPAVSEVLQQLMGHDEASDQVSFLCPWGCWRVYQNVRGSWLQHTSGVNSLRYNYPSSALTYIHGGKNALQSHASIKGVLYEKKTMNLLFFVQPQYTKREKSTNPICC